MRPQICWPMARSTCWHTLAPAFTNGWSSLETGDLFYPESGRLAGRLRSLDIEVQSGAFLASAAEVVEQLVFAFAVRTIAPDVMQANDPQLARKLFLKARRTAHNREVSDAPAAFEQVATKSAVRRDLRVSGPRLYGDVQIFFIVNHMARSMLERRSRDTGTRSPALFMGPVTRTQE